MSIKYIRSEYDDLNLNGFFVYISAKVAFFRLPKTEDHFTGHRYEIEPIGFLHVIGNCLMRLLRVVRDLTDNRESLKKNHTSTLKRIGC